MYMDRIERENMSGCSDSFRSHQEGKSILLMNVKKGVSLVNIISMFLVVANTMLTVGFIFFSSVYFLQSP